MRSGPGQWPARRSLRVGPPAGRASHRRGQELLGQIAKALLNRGGTHLAAGALTDAANDCDRAAALGGSLTDVVQLRRAVSTAMAEQRKAKQVRDQVIGTARRHADLGQLTVGEQAHRRLARSRRGCRIAQAGSGGQAGFRRIRGCKSNHGFEERRLGRARSIISPVSIAAAVANRRCARSSTKSMTKWRARRAARLSRAGSIWQHHFCHVSRSCPHNPPRPTIFVARYLNAVRRSIASAGQTRPARK